MNKKILTIVALIMTVCTVSAFSWGIGIQGGTDVANGGHGNVAITFKLDTNNFIFAVEVPSFNPLAVGVSADYWFLNNTIANPLKWYLGAGLMGAFYIGNDVAAFSFGARVPVGLNMFLDGFFEPYLQIAPGVAISISNGIHPGFVCPVNFGMRFWF